ncbi:hypothetical protein DEU56DRAFT_863148 [Suillus clintonianus]|uniref:uncharacterized protein n=1 Tax=Suillus clintonianus TaxID=1904413 RepID=UPI001B86843C|nr:uncharacterized protein DEU56DRAFT_863148 [Suillus clintonianus]KAG2124872.1 hypothetical protein DEU56DRAFT_863148 [Suillus clintonianus]
MASRGMPMDAAVAMSALLEGILYGFSALMFIGTICALTCNHRMQDINRPVTVVAILLMILSTAHMAVNIIRVEDGLVKYRDTYPGGPSAFFQDVSQDTYVIKHAFYVMQTILVDGVVIYRCYIVWQSVWVIIVPCMLWCSVAVTGIYAVYSCSQASSSNIFAEALALWSAAFLASTIATNLLSSALLAYRIWMIEHAVSTVRALKSTVMPIMRMLVDAAVLYTVVLFTALICFVCSNNGETVVMDMAMPIMSIAFYMVLICIAINRNSRSYYFSTSHGTTSEAEHGNSQHHMKFLQVYASQSTLGSTFHLFSRSMRPTF